MDFFMQSVTSKLQYIVSLNISHLSVYICPHSSIESCKLFKWPALSLTQVEDKKMSRQDEVKIIT